jgi:hypothetical protein
MAAFVVTSIVSRLCIQIVVIKGVLGR